MRLFCMLKQRRARYLLFNIIVRYIFRQSERITTCVGRARE